MNLDPQFVKDLTVLIAASAAGGLIMGSLGGCRRLGEGGRELPFGRSTGAAPGQQHCPHRRPWWDGSCCWLLWCARRAAGVALVQLTALPLARRRPPLPVGSERWRRAGGGVPMRNALLTASSTSACAFFLLFLLTAGQPAINGYFIAGSVVGPGGLSLIKEIVQVGQRARCGYTAWVCCAGFAALRSAALCCGGLKGCTAAW